MPKSVGVIGAGPGGLAAAAILRREGFDVEVFELRDKPGGRNSKIHLGEFKFDTGPTFFLMPGILEGIFQRCGKSLSEYVKLHKIDPLYKLDFGPQGSMWPSSDPKKTSQELAKFSKRDGENFWAFRKRQIQKFNAVFPALKNSADKIADLIRLENFPALPYLDLRSVYSELADFFEDERSRLAFTFQAKYLGMSPFECPSLFSILPHIEHDQGVWHPEGGCGALSEGMAKLFQDLGGAIHYNCPIESVETQNGAITHILTSSGEKRKFDHYVMNVDFSWGMKNLFSEGSRQKFKNEKLEKLKYSCSTFMLYLGLDRKLDWPHHAIYFSKNYRKNLRELCETFEISGDPSFYVHNPSNLDPSLAPDGKSALYVLVPAPQLHPSRTWQWAEMKEKYRKLILDLMTERCGQDIRPFIVQEKIITPQDWQDEYQIFRGATFSLAHSPDQLMQNRPRNQNEDFRNLFIVGGGTHPGSGLPTIYQSGILAADKILAIEKNKNSFGFKLPNPEQFQSVFKDFQSYGTQWASSRLPLVQGFAQESAKFLEKGKVEKLLSKIRTKKNGKEIDLNN